MTLARAVGIESIMAIALLDNIYEAGGRYE